jgi:paraquat-inducible protein B
VRGRTNRWKLGLFVLGGTGALIAGLVWLGIARLQPATHEAWAYFDEAVTGLDVGSPVKFRGVSIGTVASISVAPDKKHLAVHTLLYDSQLTALGLDPGQLEPNCPLPPGLRAQIVTSYLTQTSFVQVDFFSDDPEGTQKFPFQVPVNTIRTVRSTFKSIEAGLRDLLRELPELATEARALLAAARQDLADARLPELSKRFERTLQVAEQRITTLDELPVMQSAHATLDEIKGLAAAWRAPAAPTEALLQDLRELAGTLQGLAGDLRKDLAAAEVPATAASLRTAGDAAQGLGRDLRAELVHLRGALLAIERLATLLEREPGALLRGRSQANSPLRDE